MRFVLSIAAVLGTCAVIHAAQQPRNVILMVGDGMGYEHVRAAGMYGYGSPGSLVFESFPHQASITTHSANSSITDSAAAATAMATGHKVNNGVISMEYPGSGAPLQTMLEYYAARGRNTGLVTTTYMTHATPAAFGAHEPSRNNLSRIAQDYLYRARPNVLLGGGRNGMSVSAATSAGYTVAGNRTQLAGITPGAEFVSGQFGTSHMPYEYDYYVGSSNGYDTLPHLSEMAAAALGLLQDDPDGMFLMVEGGRIDHAAHDNNIQRNVFETLEFENAVQTVFDWAAGRDDTLILVTADHETGGLSVLQDNGIGEFPTVSWSTDNHTGANVPLYAWGVNAELASGTLDNTDIFTIATAPEPSSFMLLLFAGALIRSHRRLGRT